MDDFEQARALLREFKGDAYASGFGALSEVGHRAARAGRRAALVRGTFPGSQEAVAAIRRSLAEAGVALVAECRGARPNAPRDDLLRIAGELRAAGPDLVISLGGGSTIDAVKAAEVLRTLGGEVDAYFGTGLVGRALAGSGRALAPHLAVQTVASSAAHLTKYSNITDPAAAQKKLIVDDAIVPAHPLFDYGLTCTTPAGLTADGAMDGLSHCLEVLYGAAGRPGYERVERVATIAIRLIVEHLPRVLDAPADRRGREALCLATDLGGYAIMLGGTNGAHLTSFSLVDLLSHGRACALMNPYYTVLFAPAVEQPLRAVAPIYRRAGLIDAPLERLGGRELGLAVAEAMLRFARGIGFPTRLAEVPGFGPQHVERALAAARNPQLKMKLENMPIPLTADRVDETMGPLLRAAAAGDLDAVPSLAPPSSPTAGG